MRRYINERLWRPKGEFTTVGFWSKKYTSLPTKERFQLTSSLPSHNVKGCCCIFPVHKTSPKNQAYTPCLL